MTRISPGQLLADKYRVQEVLGEGAMGVVVAAEHVELDKRVAVKFMKLDALPGRVGIERFIREARAAARLQTEHVCQVFDVGRLDDGAPYIVMELLRGEDLHARFARVGVLAESAAIEYGLQVCDAMAEAHAAGIVHRDLKPQNLFVSRTASGRERIKVLDFGVSKVHAAGDLIQTRTAAVMGTPAYMSPEQLASSKHVDGRADIWSIGVILYELTTGVLPFPGDDLLALAIAIAQTTPRPPRELRSELSPGFQAVVLRCLEKDRDRRFASAVELADALRAATNLVERAPLTALAVAAAPTRVSHAAPPTTLGGAASQSIAPTSTHRGRWLAAGVGVIVAASIAIVGVSRRDAHEIAPTAAPPRAAGRNAAPAEVTAQPLRGTIRKEATDRPTSIAPTDPAPAPAAQADAPVRAPAAAPARGATAEEPGAISDARAPVPLRPPAQRPAATRPRREAPSRDSTPKPRATTSAPVPAKAVAPHKLDTETILKDSDAFKR